MVRQQLLIILTSALIALGSLAVAGWAVVTGQVFKQGLDALFLIIVCLTLAAAFAFVPARAWMTGTLQAALGMAMPAVETEVEFVDTTIPDHLPAARSFYIVWFWLLAMTAVEVVLAYIHVFSAHLMLAVLMMLSLVKAALIVAFFMHMKYERRTLILTVLPATMVMMTLLCMFFPDSFRILELGVR